MFEKLEKIDPGVLTMVSGSGKVIVSNKLQGRIFASLNDQLVHRFLDELAADPDPVEFNNLGGNSLWPGPEGGDFAFNYPPNGSWYVQDGINRVPTVTVENSAAKIVVEKNIELLNRKGNTVKLKFRRTVIPLQSSDFPAGKYDVEFTGYHSVDELIPLAEYPVSEAICCAWSLEQFPGAEGIIGFGRCLGPAANCANSDFYGDPAERLVYQDDIFRFDLGGPSRLQIGVKAESAPVLLGAIDPQRKTLALRMTPARPDGRYINIADNDQTSGPYGAADMFSIFNGSQELDFHELETISPMSVDERGILQPCVLESFSLICRGELDVLKKVMKEEFQVVLPPGVNKL